MNKEDVQELKETLSKFVEFLLDELKEAVKVVGRAFGYALSIQRGGREKQLTLRSVAESFGSDPKQIGSENGWRL